MLNIENHYKFADLICKDNPRKRRLKLTFCKCGLRKRDMITIKSLYRFISHIVYKVCITLFVRTIQLSLLVFLFSTLHYISAM